jgi:hypothetical protein
MGLLNRSSSNKTPPTENHGPRPDRFDPFLGDDELRTAFRALVDGDWNRLERFLDVSPNSWMFGPTVTSPLLGLETVTFERWVEFKESPRARTYYASVKVRDAYTDRGWSTTEPGPAGSEAEAERFTKHLMAAEEILHEAVVDRPAMVDPWVTLLVSGRGLQLDLEQLRERFDNAHSRSPFRPDACREYMQSLAKKWNGSTIATFDFARWIEAESPPDSPARECLPMAHIEKGLLERGPANLASYLMDSDVVAELATGLLNFLEATPAPAPAEHLGVLNAYALALTVDSEATARLVNETFARIDGRPSEYPWSIYAEDIADVFSEIQADQLRFASRH